MRYTPTVCVRFYRWQQEEHLPADMCVFNVCLCMHALICARMQELVGPFLQSVSVRTCVYVCMRVCARPALTWLKQVAIRLGTTCVGKC